MRNRLIELMMAMNTTPELTCPRYNTDETCKGCQYEKDDNCDFDTREADYLIANGVIVPTLKPDDFVYRCGEENVHEWQIVRIGVYPDEIVYIDDSDNEIFEDDIGKTVFLTREEAEQALQRKDEGKNGI